MFYRAVVQAVLLFETETWVLSVAMSRNLEGLHMGLLIPVMGKKSKRQRYRTCRSEATANGIKEAGTQTLGAYIYKRQDTGSEWVALRSILDIFDRNVGYKGWGRRRELWRRQTAARKQLTTMLEGISAVARARLWESIRNSKGGEGREVAEYDSGSNRPRYARTETDESQVVK